MKKAIILAVFIISLLVLPTASATILDWITGKSVQETTTFSSITDWLTGRSIEETTTLAEQATCLFANADATQKCYTDDGAFSCSGAGSCVVSISGEKDKQLSWKSSCGGEFSTIIDGVDESISFNCPQLQPAPTPTQPVVEEVKELIKCVFLNSASLQKCYTSDGKFSCSGTESCEMGIYGGKGSTLSWRSSCGGEFSTIIDGVDESISFNCPQLQPAPTPAPPAVEQVKERIKCVFINSASLQKCYTSDGKFSCSGTESCEMEVYGEKGNTLPWKSSCGGYSMTIIDNNNEELKFNCESTKYPIATPVSEPTLQYPTQEPSPQPPSASQPTITPPPTEQIKEAVKCIFTNSDSGQYCYTEDKRFGCKGVGTCAAESYGKQGENLIWRSSCEGYAETIVDGVADYATFKCKPAAASQPSSPAQPVQILPAIKEKVKCLFVNAQTPQLCVNEYPDSGCKGIGSCIDEDVIGEQGKKMVWKSSCGGGYAYTVMDGEDEYVEFTCPQTPTPPTAQEQITCLFANADATQKCYADDEKYGCSSSGEIYTKNVNGQEVRYLSCKADVSGEQGQKLTWKSSCGGYGYTVIDGSAEDAEFSCIPSTEVSKEQISDKGFRRAYWECYDGTGAETSPAYCKSSEVWQADAQSYCQDNCYTDEISGITKCGVNSFSVSEECYLEYGQEGMKFVTPEPAPTFPFKEETPREGFFKPNDGLLYLFYREDCPHCEGMKKVLDEVGSKLGVPVGIIDAADTTSYGTLLKEMSIAAVPTVVYKRSDEHFIKYLGKADSTTIINWLTGKETTVERTIEKEKNEVVKEEILFCKDSCPQEGKCYPFGYRKEGKFCSDNGAFVEQLSEDNDCDNNFECSTNVCVDGKCISSGLIQNFLSWFKKLFR